MTPRPIVALDVASESAALALVDELSGSCDFYKVGLELYTAAGPSVVRAIRDRGCDVFLDLKLHDIPNTVAGAVRSAAALGAKLVTVHASGGETMVRAAVDAAGDPSVCGILGVTLLTSLSAADVAAAWGRKDQLDTTAEVLRLAAVAQTAGAHGVVCSGLEAGAVRARFGERLRLLVPGVRKAGGATQDQRRVVTPAEAAAAGASYVVLGRIVTAEPDRRAAFSAVVAELG